MLDKIKSRKFVEYKIQLAISENPHMENREELWKLLNENEQGSSGIPPEDSFDKEGLDGLKFLMAKGTGFNIK